MMWAFALWGLVHILVWPEPSTIIISAAIIVLALVGAAGQDRKKLKLIGEPWKDWRSRTSFVPFGRGAGFPDVFALLGGTLLFFAATWLHPFAVGPWRWLG